MADILIRGMEMPACGFQGWIEFSGDGIFRILDVREEEVAEEHEYIELPPHGRLGDLDRLEKRFTPVEAYYPTEEDRRDYDNGRLMIRDIRSAIKDAPTIIPASEVKNDG